MLSSRFYNMWNMCAMALRAVPVDASTVTFSLPSSQQFDLTHPPHAVLSTWTRDGGQVKVKAASAAGGKAYVSQRRGNMVK